MKSGVQFQLGRLVITSGAEAVLQPDEAAHLLRRHVTGDFGEMDAHDRRANYDEMRTGGRVHSAYTLASGERIWIITDQQINTTTILLPEEY
jgi:hypothetical protein